MRSLLAMYPRVEAPDDSELRLSSYCTQLCKSITWGGTNWNSATVATRHVWKIDLYRFCKLLYFSRNPFLFFYNPFLQPISIFLQPLFYSHLNSYTYTYIFLKVLCTVYFSTLLLVYSCHGPGLRLVVALFVCFVVVCCCVMLGVGSGCVGRVG